MAKLQMWLVRLTAFLLGKKAKPMAKPKGKNNITCSEAGQRGGMVTLARHGVEHFRKAGAKGQASLSKRYITTDRSAWGKLGGRPRKPLIKLGEEK